MSNLKSLRERKKTAQAIGRMAAAVKMVAQAKFNKLQAKNRHNRQACDELLDISSKLLYVIKTWEKKNKKKSFSYPLLESGKNGPWVVLVMTSDSGLCGYFNQRLLKEARHLLTHPELIGKDLEFISIGKNWISGF